MIVSDRRSHILWVIVKWSAITELWETTPINYNFEKKFEKNPKLILEFFYFMEKYFFQVKYEKKIQRNSSYFFENKIIFILKYLGAKNCHFRWLHIFKVIGKSIADHDRDRRSWDFQNMIVSDRRSQFGKMIVSDRRSQKKVLSLTLFISM